MRLSMRYFLCILIYILMWKEFEAQTTPPGEDPDPDAPKNETTAANGTEASPEANANDNPENKTTDSPLNPDDIPVSDSTNSPNANPSDNRITTSLSPDDKTAETAKSSDEPAASTEEDSITTTDTPESIAPTEPIEPKQNPKIPNQPIPDDGFMDNIKIILIMNSIILLVITLIIISILIYYVFVLDKKNKTDSECDEQCFCENNRGNCMSEC